MRAVRALLAGCAFALLVADAAAQSPERPLLHPLFQDHAVLQQGRPLTVWGWARPGERVELRLDSGGMLVARADRAGSWRLRLPPLEAGGPHTIAVSAGERRQIVTDLLAGDVYVCSGQSNMEFPTRLATNSEALLREPSNLQFRLFNVSRRLADAPLASFDAPDRWELDAPGPAADFSAVCYLFGREVQRTQHVPIGLIHASWGGTPIEAWMSAPALRRAGRGDQLELAAAHAHDPGAAEARFAERMRQWRDERDRGIGERWSALDLEDRDWTALAPEGFWESAGAPPLAQLDGIVWFRTEFRLTAAQAAQGGQFELGPADDIDITFLNGREIGAVAGWDTPRIYAIAPGVLREGRNVLAASVLDTGGGGGFWGPAEQKLLRLADGTSISLSAPWRFRVAATLAETGAPPRRPWGGPSAYSALFNGMVAPLGAYGARAVLWYQGEANADAPQAYGRLLPAMFADWRTLFESRDLEFYVVQLASFGAPAINEPTPGGWGAIRDVQRRAVAADEHAGLVVAVDIGDRRDIHPTQKLVLAERLARLARHRLYGENIVESGPLPVEARRDGGAIVVSFTHGPLATYSGVRPFSFELCTSKRVCRFADAHMEGARVWIENAAGEDVFVRYCWGDSPICNLFNAADLPAAPFELAIED